MAENLPEGLTAQQAQAAKLLASGRTTSQVCEDLGVHRSTVWSWRRSETFEAFHNGLMNEVRDDAINGLRGLHGDAIEAIRRILHSDSPASALKAAALVLDQVKSMTVGPTDPRAIIISRIGMDPISKTLAQLGYGELDYDSDEFAQRCRQLGIDDG